jgi:hypothetical protein
MLYETIADMLSTSDNMTVIRNGSRNDDGTDTVTGVDWFKFRNVVANNVYVNGNGWLNFGTNAEGGLKVNRRDQASWYVWREEGSIRLTDNRFLRIRWRGYSYYNTTAAANLLDFDVVLLSTGDIVLRITTWPTANNDGVNRLEATSNVPYTPSETSKEFTFFHQDSTGNSFTVRSGIEEVFNPKYYIRFVANGGYGSMPTQNVYCGEATPIRTNNYLRRDYTFMGWDTDESSDTVVYQDGETVTDLTTEEETATLYAVWRQSMGWLFKDNAGHFYTAEQESGGQTRVLLDELHALSAEAFYTHGCTFPPDSDLMIDLDAPTIYKWDAFTPPVLTAKVDAVPVVPQLVVFATVTLLSAIKYVQIFGDTETPWNVSFDNGLSWYKYQGGWLRVSAAGDGTVKGKLEILTAADWAQMANNSIKFRCWLYAGGWTKGLRIDY